MLVQVGFPGIFTLLIVYMLVNIWTDVHYLKTKNAWHLLFLIGFTFIALATGHMLVSLLALLLTLGTLYLNNYLPHQTLGAGDFKMLAICAVGLQLMYGCIHPFYTSIAFVCMYIVCSFLQESILKLICWLKRTDLHFLQYRIQRKQTVTPEAVPIFISMMFYTIMGEVLR